MIEIITQNIIILKKSKSGIQFNVFSIVCYSKRFGPRGIGHRGAGSQSIGLTCDLNDEIERYLKIPKIQWSYYINLRHSM